MSYQEKVNESEIRKTNRREINCNKNEMNKSTARESEIEAVAVNKKKIQSGRIEMKTNQIKWNKIEAHAKYCVYSSAVQNLQEKDSNWLMKFSASDGRSFWIKINDWHYCTIIILASTISIRSNFFSPIILSINQERKNNSGREKSKKRQRQQQ